MNQSFITLKINVATTRKVIDFHTQGYSYDFSVTNDHQLICVQDDRLFTAEQVMVNLIDHRFDEISSGYKYLHLIETCCGDKGLLMDSRPWGNAVPADTSHAVSPQRTQKINAW